MYKTDCVFSLPHKTNSETKMPKGKDKAVHSAFTAEILVQTNTTPALHNVSTLVIWDYLIWRSLVLRTWPSSNQIISITSEFTALKTMQVSIIDCNDFSTPKLWLLIVSIQSGRVNIWERWWAKSSQINPNLEQLNWNAQCFKRNAAICKNPSQASFVSCFLLTEKISHFWHG